jgi:hypothetical protein
MLGPTNGAGARRDAKASASLRSVKSLPELTDFTPQECFLRFAAVKVTSTKRAIGVPRPDKENT